VLLNKTLIIFDTNILRNVLKNTKMKDPIIYHSFEFGIQFETIASFITDNNLEEYVELAVPKIVIDELKKQKIASYYLDLNLFAQIHSLITKLPIINREDLKLPDSNFDYEAYLEQISERFLKKRKIRLIDLPDDNHLRASFQRIINRALNTQPPFRKQGEKSDVGFKDALIWESILSYSEISNFDKTILFTGDNVFSGECVKEFEDNIKRNISIKKLEGEVTDELAKDYASYIENYELVKYTNTVYFKDKILDEIIGKGILSGTEVHAITKTLILDPSVSIETVQSNDDPPIELTKIKSELKVTYQENNGDFEMTLLADFMINEINEIVEAHFDPELIEL
jgi:hypothetical protein